MDDEMRRLMETVERSSQVSMDDMFRIAEAIQYSDLSDEATVRQLVKQLAYVANRSISPEKEEQIVQSILNNNIPTSFEELQGYFK
ncbi:MAG TPA: stage VI sporulation protein F [Pseudogracilibacillus sp.]|nr:stage VI sporulation protein F [Pseudogracilibacillus sp.]